MQQPCENEESKAAHNHFFEIVGVYTSKGYPILFINLYPVQYHKSTNELLYTDHLTVQVTTKPSISPCHIRNVPEDEEAIKQFVDNPSTIHTYTPSVMVQERETVEYVIITNDALAAASGEYTFQDLLQSKLDKGMTAELYTVEDINADPAYWVNGTWGDNNPANPFYNSPISGNYELFDDTQAHIRNFIRYAYTELGTNYVLLGGDADVAVQQDNIIPLRGLYACEDGLPLLKEPLDFEEDDIPSDVYYACLDGNFNYDMDDHFGENETQNDLATIDEADLLSEISVGRACVDAEDEVSNFVMKTLTYEASEGDPYLTQALMVGEYLGFPGVSQWGGNYKDLIIPYIPEEVYAVDTLYERETSWTKYTLMNMLNSDTLHLLNHLGHGNQNYALKLYNSDIQSLTNTNFFFVYSQTCLAGSFDNWNPWYGYVAEDSAAEYFTVETPHGAFAVIMNARYGLGSENTLNSPSQYLDESFFKALFTENIRELGQANHYSKEDNIWHINENGLRWAYYETNLFGDPQVGVQPLPDEKPPTTTLSYDGDAGENDWYVSPGHIILDAEDEMSEVEGTYFKINNGEWETYTGPISYTEEGVTTVRYYSVDTAGNEEEIHVGYVKLDFNAPSVVLTKETLSNGDIKFIAHVMDETSGACYAEFYLDGDLQCTDIEEPFEWTWTKSGFLHQIKARGYDEAGLFAEDVIRLSNGFAATVSHFVTQQFL
jgi:hypothetical protein